jgi:hypothetical protein
MASNDLGEFLERLRSRGRVELTESVVEAVAAEREGRTQTLYLLTRLSSGSAG